MSTDSNNGAPETSTITVAQYVHSVGRLVADVSRRHKLPPGVAFNVVAFGVQHLDQQAAEAEQAQATAAMLAGVAKDEQTLDDTEEPAQ